MGNDRDQDKNSRQQADQKQHHRERHRSSAFKETSRGDEKSTKNIEEEAHLEQERKEARPKEIDDYLKRMPQPLYM